LVTFIIFKQINIVIKSYPLFRTLDMQIPGLELFKNKNKYFFKQF